MALRRAGGQARRDVPTAWLSSRFHSLRGCRDVAHYSLISGARRSCTVRRVFTVRGQISCDFTALFSDWCSLPCRRRFCEIGRASWRETEGQYVVSSVVGLILKK